MFEIYRITNTVNGKMYIGQTKAGAFKRFQQHTKADTPLGRAIRKYGVDNFKINILSTTNEQDEANKLEEYFIKEHQCVVPDGYNLNEQGRLVGAMESKYIVWFRRDKEGIIKNADITMCGYISKICFLINKDMILKKNHMTSIKTWSELWEMIGCKKRTTQQKIKSILTFHNIIVKTDKCLIANPDVLKVYY